MTKSIQFRLLSAAAIATLALAACSSEKPAEGAAAESHEEVVRTSSAGLPDGRLAEGQKLAQSQSGPTKQACIECHGPNGDAPTDPTYPIIAGQYADYLAHSMVQYRDGKRKNSVMAGQVGHLNDQEIADLATYFASQKTKLTNLAKGYE